MGDNKEDSMRTLHTKQLDYLYTQLDSLKKNMKEKQSCLGKIIDVQKMMIDEQSRVIRDMTDKMTDNKIKKEELTESKEDEKFNDPIVKNQNIPIVSPCKKVTPKNFRQLYQKALDGKKVEDDIYETVDEEDDDDNDSFITINSSDDDSDYTLENSESSDSGIIEHDFDSTASFGINPLFSKHSKDQMSTTSRACKEFVYIPQREEGAKSLLLTGNTVGKTLKSHMVTKTDRQRMTGSGRSQRKIVILNDESAMIVNESCLI